MLGLVENVFLKGIVSSPVPAVLQGTEGLPESIT
jgi:hypothetical protein